MWLIWVMCPQWVFMIVRWSSQMLQIPQCVCMRIRTCVHTRVGERVLQVLCLYTSIQNYLVHPKRELGKVRTCLLSFTSIHLLRMPLPVVISASVQPITSYFSVFSGPENFAFIPIHEDGHLTLDMCHHLEVLHLETGSNYKPLLFHLMYILNLSKPALSCHF